MPSLNKADLHFSFLCLGSFMQIMQVSTFSRTSFHIKSEFWETEKQNTAKLHMLTRTFFFIRMQFYDLYNQYKQDFHIYMPTCKSNQVGQLLLFRFCTVRTKPFSVVDVSQLTAIINIPFLTNTTEFLHFNYRLTAKPFLLLISDFVVVVKN